MTPRRAALRGGGKELPPPPPPPTASSDPMLDDSCWRLDESIRLRMRVRAVTPPPSAAVPPASEV